MVQHGVPVRQVRVREPRLPVGVEEGVVASRRRDVRVPRRGVGDRRLHHRDLGGGSPLPAVQNVRYFAAGSDVMKSTVLTSGLPPRAGRLQYRRIESDFDQLVGVLGELALDVFARQRDA